ncbi:MAG: RidA family protein [Ruminococcaceae bacterium]|nr:RidA family protein [Oscillospiraceae bacterium]
MGNKVETSLAPAAIGPYSQAMVVGDLIFTSGQIALDPETGVLVGENVTEQSHRVCKNLEAVLTAAGGSLTSVVKTVCYLADMADFSEFNGVYAQYFTEKPARSCVAVKALPKGALVEVEVIAEKLLAAEE